MSESGTIVKITCAFCVDGAESNPEVKACMKCTKPFCAEHASRISPNFCKDCFAELAVVIDKYTKVEEEYDEKSDSVVTHKQSCRRIRLDGPDFVWYSIAITLLTDEELKQVLEFHRYMVTLIESTSMIRTVKASQALAGQKQTRTITTSTTTEVKKTRKVKTQKSLRDVLIASGITDPATLDSMLKAAGVTA